MLLETFPTTTNAQSIHSIFIVLLFACKCSIVAVEKAESFDLVLTIFSLLL